MKYLLYVVGAILGGLLFYYLGVWGVVAFVAGYIYSGLVFIMSRVGT